MASLPCGRAAIAMVGRRGVARSRGGGRFFAAGRGLVDEDGKSSHANLDAAKPRTDAALAKIEKLKKAATEHSQNYFQPSVNTTPYIGAKPILLKEPKIASEAETARATRFVVNQLNGLVKSSPEVLIVMNHDFRNSFSCKDLLSEALDDEKTVKSATTAVSLGNDWLHTIPRVDSDLAPPPVTKDKLVIILGTPGKYLTMCMKTKLQHEIGISYESNRLMILCRGACMLPLATQMQNVIGVDEEAIAEAVLAAVKAKGPVAWGHGVGTKEGLVSKAFQRYLEWPASPPPPALDLPSCGDQVEFEQLTAYIKFLNQVKLGSPTIPVKNYYDTGLLVSIMMNNIVEDGVSLLTDQDGLAILRDASIGHMISKLNQLVTVPALSKSKGVYNCFIGDGACRLNGGIELAFHLMEGKEHESMINLFVFNNHKWAIEDNLVAETEIEHVLHNKDYYDLLPSHPNVAMCENIVELKATLEHIAKKTNDYVAGNGKGGLNLIVVRGMDIEVPPVLGDLDPIRKSAEMSFMRDVLGKFSHGCDRKIPIYGCSAFEYIQFLHMFMDEMPEAKKYTYICGRTDIQAAHMCGFEQPDGKCVLFINDIYGINSLAESLRMILSGFGGKQVIVMIWHPSLINTIDNFHLHRPPMVWPSIGPQLAGYYVRKSTDALIVEWDGDRTAGKVGAAIEAKVPLILVNMLPEQERDVISLDIRAKVDHIEN